MNRWPDLKYLDTNHRSAMALWKETGRKYWLNRAASYWRQIERATKQGFDLYGPEGCDWEGFIARNQK